MKRARFESEVLDHEQTYEEWLRSVLAVRRGEAPYELLCEWRRAYGVPASEPYVTTRLVQTLLRQDRAGFQLEFATDRCAVGWAPVLLYARIDPETRLPRVTLHHETGTLPYQGWRVRRREAPPLPNALLALPADVWAHMTGLFSPSQLLALMNAPLCKAWRALWAKKRMQVAWQRVLQKLCPNIDPYADSVTPQLLITAFRKRLATELQQGNSNVRALTGYLWETLAHGSSSSTKEVGTLISSNPTRCRISNSFLDIECYAEKEKAVYVCIFRNGKRRTFSEAKYLFEFLLE